MSADAYVLAHAADRIAAYRVALEVAADALADAEPFVWDAASSPTSAEWARDRAAEVHASVRRARALIAAELAVRP